jgi:DNA-binding LytR/AlgR family response regulator
MRLAYCDDEKVQSIFLKELLDDWAKIENSHYELAVYGSAEEMLFEHSTSFPFDFILLDIELDKMNGIELARKIREVDKEVIIAFLSNSREYVFDGYEVQAIRYLVKPLTKEQLYPLLHLVKKASEVEKKYIIIGNAGERIKLYIEDILFIEASGHYIRIKTLQDDYEVKMNINNIAEKLNNTFIAAHRSYLVNLSFIEKISKSECYLKNGWTIPISRSSYKDVNQAFISFYRGGAF